jgi:hypothetical protein
MDIDDDDILPKRVVGEEPIARDALDQVRGTPASDARARSDAGNLDQSALAADPYDEDLTGSPPIEQEPDSRDIMPDQIKAMPGAVDEDDDDREITARPSQSIRPILPQELPEG